MNSRTTLGVTIVCLFAISDCFSQSGLNGFDEEIITNSELSKWKLAGIGEVSEWGDLTTLKEVADSKGIMLVSLKSYPEDVIVKYKALALTPATVIVTMLSISDIGDSREISIPENYDGSLGMWWDEKENYFFSFKNAPHDGTPYLRKNPKADHLLSSASKNYMIAGVYYQIEIGSIQGRLWLSIDDQKVFEVEDDKPLSGGHIAIRLRGTAGFEAGCLIKDLRILSKKH